MTGSPGGSGEFLGLRFNMLDLELAKASVFELGNRERFSYVVTPNVDHVVQLHRTSDPAVKGAYAGAELLLCDSRILARLARLSGLRLPIVPGSDLTRMLLSDARSSHLRIAVVGGDPSLHQKLERLYPQVDWAFYAPPMRIRHDVSAQLRTREFVERCGADLCFFAIGAPQSELLCAEIRETGQARGVALCVGASLEFLTGAKVRAPTWMQSAGFEWLHRLLQEPGRLWRRYLVDGPRIFAIWWRWRANRLNPLVLSGSSRSGDS